MDYPPDADDHLYSAVHNGDLLDVQQAIDELKEPDRSAIGCSMIASISTNNILTPVLLLGHGELEEEVVEAAAASGDLGAWMAYQLGTEAGLDSFNCEATKYLTVIGPFLTIRNADFLRSLIAPGSEPNKKSNLDETALSFATRDGAMKAVKLLLISGADVTRGCLREPSEDTHELIAMLIQRGVRINAYRQANKTARMMRYRYPQRTALHVACKQQNHLAARTLFEFEANPYYLQTQGERYGPPSPYDLTTPGSAMRTLFEHYVRR